MTDRQQLLWLWLAGVLGFGAEHSGELLALYGDAEEVYRARHSEDFSAVLSAKQVTRLQDDSRPPESYALILGTCQRKSIRIITWADPDYPRSLRRLPDAPPVLYCTGQSAVLNRGPMLGMVGSRQPSAYGVRAAETLSGALAKAGAVIVSGLADGLDGVAHQGALQAGGITVGVLGCAIDKTYPANHSRMRWQMEQQGAVLSEYPPGCRSYGSYFLQRNRLIAGLSDVLCVVEARKRSGTMSTVHHAQRYGREVYAVPGSVFDPVCEGTNQLLADGEAKPANSAKALAGALGLRAAAPKTAQKQPAPVTDPVQQTLLDALAGGPAGLEALSARTGLSAGQVLAALTRLELTGRVQALAGGRYGLRS